MSSMGLFKSVMTLLTGTKGDASRQMAGQMPPDHLNEAVPAKPNDKRTIRGNCQRNVRISQLERRVKVADAPGHSLGDELFGEPADVFFFPGINGYHLGVLIHLPTHPAGPIPEKDFADFCSALLQSNFVRFCPPHGMSILLSALQFILYALLVWGTKLCEELAQRIVVWPLQYGV